MVARQAAFIPSETHNNVAKLAKHTNVATMRKAKLAEIYVGVLNVKALLDPSSAWTEVFYKWPSLGTITVERTQAVDALRDIFAKVSAHASACWGTLRGRLLE